MHPAELAQLDYLRKLAERLQSAGHGQRGALIDDAMQWLCVSKQTLYTRLRGVGWTSGRKLRADKGDSRVSDTEAMKVAGLIRSSMRDTGRQTMPMKRAIDIALANDMLAEPVSPATMSRVMRRKGIHPHQLARPTPHMPMQSDHPNWCWQLDASICVLYYLNNGTPQVMDERKFNARKPRDMAKIATKRVLRYAITDHASGTIIARYYHTAGEDSRTLFDFLMFAMQRQEGRVMHGVPIMLVWDAGSANQSHAIKALLTGLGIVHWPHVPGNPRAKGQVEGAHNIIETQFESGLRCTRMASIEQLNEALDTWLRVWNDVRVHSRHGHTRSAIWQTIREHQLRLCPAVDVCKVLTISKPEPRTVAGSLTVQFTVRGHDSMVYSVEHIDGVRVGDKVMVAMNPYRMPSIFVVGEGEDGRTRYWECEPLAKNHLGFFTNAPRIGAEYKAPRDTATDTARKDVNEQVYGERDTLDALAARNKGRLAFDGQVDPFKDLREAAERAPSHILRRGTELDVPNPVQVELKPLTHLEAARQVYLRWGSERRITAEDNARIREWFPDGVPETELDALAQRLEAPAPQRPRLSVVG